MATPPTIYVLNGPNLNLLGLREPEIYGAETLDEIAGALEDRARALGVAIEMRQSNHEGHLIDWLHEANAEGAKAVILNAGGFTHSSVAIHDAIKAIGVPVIEVHLSNPQAREGFRRRSYVARAARGTIAGFGALGYQLALDAAARL
jgi:3-dehydroquinate dehydratase-2